MALEDVEGAAREGLCRAANRYQTDRNVKFWTFARRQVFGSIVDEVRRCGELTRAQHAAIRTQQLLEEVAQAANSTSPPPSDPDERAARACSLAVAWHGWVRSTTDAYVVSISSSADSDAASGQHNRDPETSVIVRDRNRVVRDAIRRLPERQRHIIEQHYFHDHQFSDIAAALGKDKSTISRQLGDALAALRGELLDDDL